MKTQRTVVGSYLKKLLVLGITSLFFGLAVHIPATLATEVQNDTLLGKQPSCRFSGDATYPKQIAEVRGPTLYLEAVSVFNRNSSLALVHQIQDAKIFPKYSPAREIVVKVNRTSTQALVIPLVNSEGKLVGKYYYVHNGKGSAYALVVFKTAVVHS